MVAARLERDESVLAARLLDWHRQHGRHDLPWQHPRTPYRVWLSEVMLQQTQVGTVIGYFQRFVDALPSLPALMSEGGGTGITTLTVLQSLAQARGAWGEQAAGAMWDAAITKIILGGGSNARDLADLSALIGERDEHTTATSRAQSA